MKRTCCLISEHTCCAYESLLTFAFEEMYGALFGLLDCQHEPRIQLLPWFRVSDIQCELQLITWRECETGSAVVNSN